MSFSSNVWDQIKNTTKDELIAALLKDGFKPDVKRGSDTAYWHPDGRRVTIHYHSGSDTFGPKLLQGLINDCGWSVSDLKRLKMVK